MGKEIDSASAIIIWKNKVLLFHRDNIPTIPQPDCWHFPGGGIEEGETPIEGMMRELSEEVSYVPKNLRFVGKFKRKDGLDTYLHFSFVEDEEANFFKRGVGEGQGIGFFSLEEMMNLKLSPRLKKMFIDYRKEIEEAFKTGDFKKLLKEITRSYSEPIDI